MTLEELGICPETMQRFAASCERVERQVETHRYLEGDEQKRIVARLRQDEHLILALAASGLPPVIIARNEGVSIECILKRLRPRGLTRGRGRPRKERG